LEPEIAERVESLAGPGEGEVNLRLPFLDRREWQRRGQILSSLELVREGDTIRCALDPAEAARDCAATLVLTHPAWKSAPPERHPGYFAAWQRVSVALQKSLRRWIADTYFRELNGFEDRDLAYPLVVYAASRPFYGKGRIDFTFDVVDPITIELACRMIGRSMLAEMAPIERRLRDGGRPDLARRYAAVWLQDILASVRKRPRRLEALLADEARLINAVIDLGTSRNALAVNRFSRAANAALRNVYGDDMRGLAVKALEEATRTLAAADAAGRAANAA
jgi:hypothetical protein